MKRRRTRRTARSLFDEQEKIMANQTESTNLISTDAIEKVRKLLPGFRSAMMVSLTDGGSLRARPMGLQGDPKEFDGLLWFFTAKDSGKLKEAGMNRKVCLTFQNDGDSQYLYLEGTAKEVEDKGMMEKLYTPLVRTWFPGGLQDPNLTLLRFEAEHGAFWESPGGAVQLMAAFAKSVMTGKAGAGGNTGELQL
jgi:general stress protein 26